jgi:uncharacterized YccA/Bax inhibitor family protein
MISKEVWEMMRTSNPALNDKVFQSTAVIDESEIMTMQGTVNKTFVVLAITMAAAYLAWINPAVAALMLPAAIVGLIIALVTVFKQSWSPVTTPLYAAAEGVFMGAVSLQFELQYPGIVSQAVMLTLGVLACMLLSYSSGLIKVTDKLRMGIVAATGAIFLVYLGSMLFSFFGGGGFGFLHSSSPLSIGISLVVVVVAAFNLVLDFDMIDRAAQSGGAPKYMEWYGAFALLVTLVWLYIELLRLLAKIKDR